MKKSKKLMAVLLAAGISICQVAGIARAAQKTDGMMKSMSEEITVPGETQGSYECRESVTEEERKAAVCREDMPEEGRMAAGSREDTSEENRAASVSGEEAPEENRAVTGNKEGELEEGQEADSNETVSEERETFLSDEKMSQEIESPVQFATRSAVEELEINRKNFCTSKLMEWANGLDLNKDGKLSRKECEDVTEFFDENYDEDWHHADDELEIDVEDYSAEYLKLLTNVKKIKIDGVGMDEISFAYNPKLEELCLTHSKIDHIDLSQNKELKNLDF